VLIDLARENAKVTKPIPVSDVVDYSFLNPDSAVKKYDIEEAEKKDSGSECLG
jgi:hypothetical protein